MMSKQKREWGPRNNPNLRANSIDPKWGGGGEGDKKRQKSCGRYIWMPHEEKEEGGAIELLL